MASMRCPECKAETTLGEAYCRKCGRPQRECDMREPVELAGLGRRLAAFTLDQVILALAMIPLTLVPGAWTTLVLYVLIHFSYNVAFNSTSGQTPGKKVLGIRVIPADGSQLTWRKALVRWIGYGASTATPFMLGFAWAAWDSDRQAWHDKLAGTCVVRDPASGGSEVTLPHPEFVRSKQRRWAPV